MDFKYFPSKLSFISIFCELCEALHKQETSQICSLVWYSSQLAHNSTFANKQASNKCLWGEKNWQKKKVAVQKQSRNCVSQYLFVLKSCMDMHGYSPSSCPVPAHGQPCSLLRRPRIPLASLWNSCYYLGICLLCHAHIFLPSDVLSVIGIFRCFRLPLLPSSAVLFWLMLFWLTEMGKANFPTHFLAAHPLPPDLGNLNSDHSLLQSRKYQWCVKSTWIFLGVFFHICTWNYSLH